MSYMIEVNKEAREARLIERVVRASAQIPGIDVQDIGDALGEVYSTQRKLVPANVKQVDVAYRFSPEEIKLVLERLKASPGQNQPDTLIKYLEDQLKLASKSTTQGNRSFLVTEKADSIRVRDIMKARGFTPASHYTGARYKSTEEEREGYGILIDPPIPTITEVGRFLLWELKKDIRVPGRWIGDLRFDYLFPNKEVCWRINVFGEGNLEPLVELGQELHIEFNKPVHVMLTDEQEKVEFIPN